MTEARKELREKVAIALSMVDPDSRGIPDGVTMAEFYRSLADVAIAIVLDEVAKIVEAMPRTHDRVKEGCSIAGVEGVWTFTLNNGPAECAAAIRALKGNA